MAESMTKLKHMSESQKAHEHSEGHMARTIEQQTAKMPGARAIKNEGGRS
jgi:hypothetical protein